MTSYALPSSAPMPTGAALIPDGARATSAPSESTRRLSSAALPGSTPSTIRAAEGLIGPLSTSRNEARYLSTGGHGGLSGPTRFATSASGMSITSVRERSGSSLRSHRNSVCVTGLLLARGAPLGVGVAPDDALALA